MKTILALAIFLFAQADNPKPKRTPQAESGPKPSSFNVTGNPIYKDWAFLHQSWTAIVDLDRRPGVEVSDPQNVLVCSASNLNDNNGDVIGFSYVCIDKTKLRTK